MSKIQKAKADTVDSITEKKQFPGFIVSPGSKETLIRRGGKANNHSIAYSLGNICAKISKIG